MMAQMSSVEAMLRQLVELGLRAEARDVARDNARKEKKAPRDIETPEQFMARLRSEFADVPDFDAELRKCREYYRVKRQVCRRDTISDWFIRERNWRLKNGVPDAQEKKRGLVL